jgi:short-subunit dehydrogenase
MPTVLITGGGGIGYEAAKELAKGPRFNLILAGRNLARVEPTAERIRTEYGVKVTTLQMDTSSLASVRAAATRCSVMMDRGEVDSLQAILCNAGARIEGVNYTPDMSVPAVGAIVSLTFRRSNLLTRRGSNHRSKSKPISA